MGDDPIRPFGRLEAGDFMAAGAKSCHANLQFVFHPLTNARTLSVFASVN
jgi:hypothetical protein